MFGCPTRSSDWFETVYPPPRGRGRSGRPRSPFACPAAGPGLTELTGSRPARPIMSRLDGHPAILRARPGAVAKATCLASVGAAAATSSRPTTTRRSSVWELATQRPRLRYTGGGRGGRVAAPDSGLAGCAGRIGTCARRMDMRCGGHPDQRCLRRPLRLWNPGSGESRLPAVVLRSSPRGGHARTDGPGQARYIDGSLARLTLLSLDGKRTGDMLPGRCRTPGCHPFGAGI